MSLLICKDVAVGYDGKAVVSNINFEVNAGDYLCIVGENGSGKSTLMKTILGLKKPLSGDIVFGDNLKQTEIGYLPQQTVIQKDFPASVKEIVLSGCLNGCGMRPFYNKTERASAKENMQKLGIVELEKRCYRELSGGQQQRVLLARALCATKKLILLDEPVAGLDPLATTEMYEVVKKLNTEGITVIMISHDIAMATEYANCILHIGTTPTFFSDKKDYLKNEISKKFVKASGV